MRTIDHALASSFRDPSGFLYFSENTLYRQVNKTYKDSYVHLIESGLYDSLRKDGFLIPHQEVFEELAYDSDVYKVLKPEPIPFISYPYEWCFSQLKQAALATLDIQRRALSYGMTLKDASAYNIQYYRGAPILIDSLSFEPYMLGHPWVAYRQFCQHFLAPLALMSYCDVRLTQLSKVYLDGVPLDLTSSLLPRKTYFRFGLLSHIHLHAQCQKRQETGQKRDHSSTVNKNAMLGLLDSLQSTIECMKVISEESMWSSYYVDNSYSVDAMNEKLVMVGRALDEIQPKTMWDFGSNTGRFSRVAADKGIHVIAFEADPVSSEKHFNACVKKKETMILPLIMDLTNPSSGIGWAHQERESLVERGPVDVLLALALIHHLVIANNVPFFQVAKFFSGLCKTLIIEFVPKNDSQVQRLLVSREDIFYDYAQRQFEQAFEGYFHIDSSMAIGNSGRRLYVMSNR